MHQSQQITVSVKIERVSADQMVLSSHAIYLQNYVIASLERD